MSVPIKIECPKCHADRTMLDTSFAVPGCAEPDAPHDHRAGLNPNSALPVRGDVPALPLAGDVPRCGTSRTQLILLSAGQASLTAAN
jgi:hypothetical protein